MDKSHKRQKFENVDTSKIWFDTSKYPATSSGFKLLTQNIQAAAKCHHTHLNHVESAGVLTCFRYHTLKKINRGRRLIFSMTMEKNMINMVFCVVFVIIHSIMIEKITELKAIKEISEVSLHVVPKIHHAHLMLG